MKFSLNWLKDYVALEAPAAEIARAITFLGFEVEQVIATGLPALARSMVTALKHLVEEAEKEPPKELPYDRMGSIERRARARAAR